ncbi:BLUF domain-containing protein [Ramlibacter sp. USB13]|uniref:BLUF domain-containing protein n=1 Tax=Ramlibacter cellulosilyticus TaxID=2764187 RepID=A0A923S9N3_9BURK|nr:BLUF domain-containing protein [Ramlibacter cellulosilyticus]MBC5781944.1 BLUF domain-containing protein [Ramlibacter cellulosilyticus]
MDRWEEEDGAAGAGTVVARVVYASRAEARGGIYAQMESIRASALRHNEPAGVATALLYQAGWFVQWKEGPADAVLRIMDRVATDPRHRDLRTVHRSRGPRLLCGPWSMAIVQSGETPFDMERRVLALKREVDAGEVFTPPAIWRRLSTPLRHPGSLLQQEADAFQRVLVCSAQGSDAFALVEWLARRHGADVVRRRFAGGHGQDVGTDYIDLLQDGRLLRVIAMARHGLHLPLTRAFLPDYSHVVLLLAEDADANAQLMVRVLSALRPLEDPPALLGIARTAQRHAEPAALAQRFGLDYASAEADVTHPAGCWQELQPLLAGERVQ